MIDPLGFVLTTIRSDSAVAALTTRIRGGEPAPGDASVPFQRFVVLVRGGAVRLHNAPVQTVRILVSCYGTTYADAAVLYGAVSDAIHNVGPILSGSGIGIFRMFDDMDSGADKDPVTGQPVEQGVIEVTASTVLVT
jgi:hypothetical protein